MWFINSFALSRCSWVYITFQCDGNSAFLHVTKTQLAKIGKIVLKSFLHIFYFPIILDMLHFCQTSLVIAVYPILRLWKPKCNLQLLNLSLYLQWHLFFLCACSLSYCFIHSAQHAVHILTTVKTPFTNSCK